MQSYAVDDVKFSFLYSTRPVKAETNLRFLKSPLKIFYWKITCPSFISNSIKCKSPVHYGLFLTWLFHTPGINHQSHFFPQSTVLHVQFDQASAHLPHWLTMTMSYYVQLWNCAICNVHCAVYNVQCAMCTCLTRTMFNQANAHLPR